MQFIIILFLVFIVATLIFIAKTYLWMSRQKVIIGQEWAKPMIIERVYKARDYRHQFVYMEENALIKYPQYWPIDGDTKIIEGSEHLNYVLEDYAREIARSLIKDGCVEITDERDRTFPLRRIINMRLKVYKA